MERHVSRIINGVAAAALSAWILYYAGGRWFFGSPGGPASVVDYRTIYHQSRHVIEAGVYDSWPLFPYPPSAVVVFYTTTIVPFGYAAFAWMAILTLATAGTIIMGTSLVGLSDHRYRWVAALIAFLCVEYFVSWDLRSLNCNMLFCFLLTAGLAAFKRGWDVGAGALLASSIALKLYPVLLVPYLCWTGRWRAFLATLFFLAVFCALLPAAAFGCAGVVKVYASWLEHLNFIGAHLYELNHPILIAIRFTLTKKLGQDSMQVGWLTQGFTALWLGLIAACLLVSRRGRGSPVTGWDLAVDGGTLALAPVVISPYLEAYHAVVAVLPMLALAQRLVAAPSRTTTRFGVAAAIASGWLALKIAGSADCRGLGVAAEMIIAVLALTAIRLVETSTVAGYTGASAGRIPASLPAAPEFRHSAGAAQRPGSLRFDPAVSAD
jgi:hypothetical protein